MSTTTLKRTRAAAIDDAEILKGMFGHTYHRWEFAGSVRRRIMHVNDVEHVIIPKFGTIAGRGLFGEEGNLLFALLDQLVATGHVTRHVYGTTGFRWGEKYRGVDFNGHLHEFFCADVDNWGPTLAIRTGPAEFSKQLVTGLLKNGYRNKDGKVWRCERCVCEGRDKLCRACEGYGLVPLEVVPAPDERGYFEMCGVAWVEPPQRG
jgi:DNA polymerase/3'-5' exonuclease PolX